MNDQNQGAGMTLAEFEELLEQSSLGRGRTREQRHRDMQEVRLQPFKTEFQELRQLDEPAPRDLRRMAELVEILRTDADARPYWERAAEAGDPDAVEYLAVLREEEAHQLIWADEVPSVASRIAK